VISEYRERRDTLVTELNEGVWYPNPKVRFIVLHNSIENDDAQWLLKPMI
jgi:hypothetical protein